MSFFFKYLSTKKHVKPDVPAPPYEYRTSTVSTVLWETEFPRYSNGIKIKVGSIEPQMRQRRANDVKMAESSGSITSTTRRIVLGPQIRQRRANNFQMTKNSRPTHETETLLMHDIKMTGKTIGPLQEKDFVARPSK